MPLTHKIFPAVCWLILLFPPFTSYTQTYYFRNYSVEHGLPFIQASAIFQDSKGYLWSGGYGGLSQFDGVNFRNFSPKKGLSNHFVTCITEDKNGNLWIGTTNGLNRYDGKKFTIYSKHDQLPGNFINALLVDNAGKLWVGTNKGLAVFDGKKFTSFTRSNGLPGNIVKCLYQGKDKQLWIGTNKGVGKINGSAFEKTSFESTVPDSLITSLCEDSHGNIWLGTSSGMYSIKAGKVCPAEYTGNKISAINTIIRDRKGKLWAGTSNGLFLFNGKSFTPYHPGKNKNSNIVQCLYSDYEDNLWLGTFNGLYQYRGSNFITFREIEGLDNSFVFQIYRDSKNRLWICTGNGVFQYDGTIFHYFSEKEGFSQNQNFSCIEEKNGTLWFGTDAGLVKYDGKKFTRYTIADGLGSNYIVPLMFDKDNNLWIGGKGSVTLYDGKSFRVIPFAKELAGADASAFLQDTDGSILIGNYQGGLLQYHNGTLVDYANILGIKSNSFMSIIRDRKKNIYFGTFEGVYRYDGKQVFNFSEKNGMSSDLVYAMALSKDEKELWAGTNQGVNKINLEKFEKEQKTQIDTYNKEEGFSGVETNSNGAFLDKDGSIWFGTVNGLIRHSSSPYEKNNKESKTHITGIRLFYADTTLENNSFLPYSSNNISFEFRGICLTNPSKVRYRYMLAGSSDKKWSPETRNNFAQFSNLSPGKYTFKVISCNNENFWNTEPSTFSFTILAPFWKTWWFWSLCTLTTLGISIAGVRYRIRQVQVRAERELQKKLEISRHEMKALRAQMNPHFIFNSLNSIQSFIMNHDEESATRYLNTFAKLIRLILYNSEKSALTIREELDLLRLYLELESLRFENKFEFRIEVDPQLDIDYHEIPTLLLQPYVENSILHGLTPAKTKGKLEIMLTREEKFIVCRIKDNGIGRVKSEQIKKDSFKKGHRSFGTKIAKTRLELLNTTHSSDLSVNITDLYNPAGEASGTLVEIFIPIT